MEFHNFTPFAALAFASVAPGGVPFHTVVLRQTFGLRDGALVLAQQQTPLATTDLYRAEPGHSSVVAESDLAPYKPRCDVVVLAVAHAPQRRAAPRFEAGVRIIAANQAGAQRRTALSYRIAVTGPRRFTRNGQGYELTEPEPVLAVPVCYEFAWGGQCRIDEDAPAAAHVPQENRLTPAQRQAHPDQVNPPIAHDCYEDNPLGMGYAPAWYVDTFAPQAIAAPQIESVDDPLTADRWMAMLSGDASAMPAPAGLGWIGRAWRTRRLLAGTYDQAWLDTRHPGLPDDFRFDYWNGAHPALQKAYLKGDETLVLDNLVSPGFAGTRTNARGDTELAIRLPGHLPMGWGYTDSTLKFAAFHADTLVVDLRQEDRPQVTLVWRATVMKRDQVRRFEARFIEPGDIARLMSASPVQQAAGGVR